MHFTFCPIFCSAFCWDLHALNLHHPNTMHSYYHILLFSCYHIHKLQHQITNLITTINLLASVVNERTKIIIRTPNLELDLGYIVAPLVEQFTFPANLTQGKRLRVICTVAEGDLPLEVIWKKNGIPILINPGGQGNNVQVRVTRSWSILHSLK